MKRLILLVLLFSSSSYGQVWDHVVDSKDTEYYLDKTSIRPNGSYISYSQMSNYLDGYKHNKQLIRSIIQSRLSDCVENKFRSVGIVGYSQFNGKGDILVVSSKPDREWVSIDMTKITGQIQREVCK